MIGLGIDIVKIDRIQKLYDRFGNKFLEKIFFPLEVIDAREKGHFVSSLAGKFASKEAWIKAVTGITNQSLSFKDVLILSDRNNKPYITIRSNEKFSSEHNFLVSISHEKDYAVAVVAVF